MDIPTFIFPSTGSWAFGLLTSFRFYEQCCYKHSYASSCLNTCFNSLTHRIEITRSRDNSMLNFLSNDQFVFHSSYTISHPHQHHTGSNFSTSSPTFIFYDTHPSRCEVSLCSFDLHFSKWMTLSIFSHAYWLFVYLL